MIISFRQIGLFILCFGTCFIFFNPLNLSNEIAPYYLLSIFFFPLRLKDYLISFVLFISALIWVFVYPSFRVFIDPIMIITTIFAFRFFENLDQEERKFFFDFFKYFIYLNVLVCILQYNFSYVQILTYSFFSGRDLSVGVSFLDRGVTGLAPEPAYGSAHIIGLALIYSAFRKPSYLLFLSITLIIFLQSSISGAAYYLLYSSFIILWYFRLSLMNLIIIYLVLLVSLVILFIQIDLVNYFLNFQRTFEFVISLISSGNIIEAEEQTGSVRLILILLSFSDLFHETYAPGFSYIGYLNRIFATPLITLFVLLILFKNYGFSLSYLIMITFALIAGPVLIWPLYYLAFYGLPKKNFNENTNLK